MTTFEKYIRAADELISFETTLNDQDFSQYTEDGLEFEKSELGKIWDKYNKFYDECSNETVEQKKKDTLLVHSKHPQVRKAYVRCINLISRARKSLDNQNTMKTDSVAHNFGGSLVVPPCDTNVFHGDYVSWPTFRDMFTAIYINNTRLSAVEKLFYLFKKTDGEARDINRNVSLTNENFEIAWNNLKTQYENKRVLINSQLKLLFNLAPCVQDSASEIKRLQREINNCISVLKLFNIDIASWDPIFVFQCSSRLLECTLNLWEQSVKNKTEVPKWDELNSFLTDRFHALESVSDILSTNTVMSGPQTASMQSSVKVRHYKAHHTKAGPLDCMLCRGKHKISSCDKFLNMDYRTRVSTLKKFRFCFNCLSIGHLYSECSSQNGCSKCRKKHHTLMHRDFVRQNQNKLQPVESQNTLRQIQSTSTTSPYNTIQSHHTAVSKKVMLATVWVNITSLGSTYKVRALIDPCSDESFISEKIQRLLKLPTTPISAEITGLGGNIVSRSNKIAAFVIMSRFDPNMSLEIQALVVPRVTGNVPTHSFMPSRGLDLPDLNFADPKFYETGEVDLLLGGNFYPLILREGVQHGILGSLVAQETIFGWIVTGPTDSAPSQTIRMAHVTKVSIDDQLTKFWELEEVSHRHVLSEDDI